MEELTQARELLDEINAAISSYDAVLKETARDILIERAFGRPRARPASARGAEGGDAEQDGEAPVRRKPGRPKGSGTGRRGSQQVAGLMQGWTPETMAERALLGAYALAKGRADRTVTSQAINAELKSNGLPVPNITRAIESNLRAKPALMVQKKKMGTTRQARKQYAITPEGVAFVEEKLRAGTED
ncbi:MAG: hypothetical protein JWM27_4657 [Gemmatimonadetes bacterium]|nr:hypothetical protein [Gemmatimonadota bacterium]